MSFEVSSSASSTLLPIMVRALLILARLVIFMTLITRAQ
ncbi:MAG: hypothetical protein CISAcid_15840 [uncultured Acidilobus sp. CIS]|nr:MAG: hypothetical protein CISAcid_15840 [uncultured Acidilobus sp. CIS]